MTKFVHLSHDVLVNVEDIVSAECLYNEDDEPLQMSRVTLRDGTTITVDEPYNVVSARIDKASLE